MRVLLIEDDAVMAKTLCSLLEERGIHVDEADRGEDGLELSDLYEYQAVVLDLGLPDMAGGDVLLNLRKGGNKVPVLVLSGKTEIEARLACLQTGADDFLVKPFNSNELVARLQALVRRANGHGDNILRFGALTLDLSAREVSVDGERVQLTAKEYQMLELMCLRQGGVVSKESFLDHLYGGIDEPEMKIIDVFICKLRKKLSGGGDTPPFIETVWGRGYRVCTEPCRMNVE